MTEITDPKILRQIIQAQTEISRLGPDLGAVIQYVAACAQQFTGAGASIVGMVEGDEMVYRAATGFASGALGIRVPRQGTFTGLSVANGQILLCTDIETDDRVNRANCRQLGIRSMVVAPLVFHNARVGTLKVAAAQPDAFSERDLSILDTMSELIAAAMFHAARFEEGELYYRATHDSLTGIANRALFYDRLRQRLALARRNTVPFGVLSFDMDGLKKINDTYGHRAGDAALRELANRVKVITRVSDTFARVGGDEFALILSEVRSRDGLLQACDRVEQTVYKPFTFEGWMLRLGVSVGHAFYPVDGQEIDRLLDVADEAMYCVKRTRSGRAAENYAV